MAIAPKAVPLRSKWAESVMQGPPGQKSVMTTLTGLPEHDGCAFLEHLIYHDQNDCYEVFFFLIHGLYICACGKEAEKKGAERVGWRKERMAIISL